MHPDRDVVTRRYEVDDFDALLDDLQKEIQLRNYRVTRVYDIDNYHDRKSREHEFAIGFERYKIVEFCHLETCAELISADLRAGVFMPVKFTVSSRPGETAVAVGFLKPTAFARLFESATILKVAAKLERDMHDVLEEIDF